MKIQELDIKSDHTISTQRILCGSSWWNYYVDAYPTRCYEHGPYTRSDDIGFRIFLRTL